MSVTLTEAAARHVKRYIAKRGKGVGVRLGDTETVEQLRLFDDVLDDSIRS